MGMVDTGKGKPTTMNRGDAFDFSKHWCSFDAFFCTVRYNLAQECGGRPFDKDISHPVNLGKWSAKDTIC